MTHQHPDDAARTAWSSQAGNDAEVDLARARGTLVKREAEVRKRDRIMYLCAAIIAPSWAAVMWFMPDLRIVAAVGFAVAVWVASQLHWRSAARLATPPVDAPCLEYQQALLQRERDLYLAMPLWYLTPIGLSQIAILIGFLASPRFPRTAILVWGAAAFVGSSSAVLLIARQRWRRKASELQRDIDLLNAATRDDILLSTKA